MNLTTREIRRFLGVLAATVAAFGAPVASAQENADPTGKKPTALEIVARHVEAIGGETALRSHTSLHRKGTFENIQQGQVWGVELFTKAPDLQLMVIDFPDRQRLGGYDGEKRWANDPLVGPQVFPGPPDVDAAPNFDFHRDLNYPKHYEVMDYVGKATFEGTECEKIRLVSETGREMYEYYDAKSGLRLAQEATVVGTRVNTTISEVFADYTDFGGVKIPLTTHTRRARNDGEPIRTQTLRFETVEWDKVDDARFIPPPDVQTAAEGVMDEGVAPEGEDANDDGEPSNN